MRQTEFIRKGNWIKNPVFNFLLLGKRTLIISMLVFTVQKIHGETTELEAARTAARAFCVEFKFPKDKIHEIDGKPLAGPANLKRDGAAVHSYRWLGGGRGDFIVQPEVNQESGQIIVFGGYGHREFGPWLYRQANENSSR